MSYQNVIGTQRINPASTDGGSKEGPEAGGAEAGTRAPNRAVPRQSCTRPPLRIATPYDEYGIYDPHRSPQANEVPTAGVNGRRRRDQDHTVRGHGATPTAKTVRQEGLVRRVGGAVSARWIPWRLQEALFLAPAAVGAFLGILVAVSVPSGMTKPGPASLLTAVLFILALCGVHIVYRRWRPSADRTLLPIASALMAAGLVMLTRLIPPLVSYLPEAKKANVADIATKHTAWILIGLAAIAAIALVRNIHTLRLYKHMLVLAGIGLVAVTLIFGNDGGTGTGSKLWLPLGPLTVQSSEFLKPLMLIYMAGYIADNRPFLERPFKLQVFGIKIPFAPLPYMIPMWIVWGVAMLLLIVQKDLGSTLLFFGMFLTLLYLASGNPLYVVGGVILMVVGIVAINWLLPDVLGTARARFEVWVDPWAKGDAGGYQLVQSAYGVATGGAFGTGLGWGRPYLVPLVESDLIPVAFAEEFGFVGVTSLLGVYLALVWRGMRIAREARGDFARLLASGLTAALGIQMIVILGGTIRMLPLTGLTLPLVSYGGSSMIATCLMLGLLLRISADAHQEGRKVRSDAGALRDIPGAHPAGSGRRSE
ncbi:MAG TPA: FtsW/RodA/SpoVE family cell cycle protein [Chloroflexia bacterium]|nr:FtsW/RodA/SpoVE family cell cycle protein [Chloroflexia bacterium]